MNDYLNSLGPLGLLQAYRAQPFSLNTDMSRPAQYLPQALPTFDYATQYQTLKQQLAASRAAQTGVPGADWTGGGEASVDDGGAPASTDAGGGAAGGK